jgi:glycosyltransferase involved in cell wall biosynthesis
MLDEIKPGCNLVSNYNKILTKLDAFHFNNDWTIVIKSFRRFGSVYRLIKSIRQFYPWAPIVIADDSGCNYPEFIGDLIRTDEYLEWYRFTTDIGLSEGRNKAVARVTTDYVVLCDDDFIFTKETKLERFEQILDNTDANLVAGNIRQDGGAVEDWGGDFDGQEIVPSDDVDQLLNGIVFQKRDITLNFYMADAEILREYPWNPEIKIGCEHQDHFRSLMHAGVRVYHTDDVIVNHQHNNPAKYAEYRSRDYSSVFELIWGFPPAKQDNRLVDLRPADHRPNLIVFGNQVQAKQAEDMGWYLGDVNSFGENLAVRDVNSLIGENKDVSISQMLTAIQILPRTWALVDQRFEVSLEIWSKLFMKLNELPTLVLPKVCITDKAQEQYKLYPGPKVII